MAAKKFTLVDGSVDWSGGVNSLKATTVQSPNNPNGLTRNELSWLINGTVRDGGITCRTGWIPTTAIHDSTGFFQGGIMYQPDYGFPYLICVISGNVWKVDCLVGTITDLSATFGVTIPATNDCFFCQAEQYLVIQAGDNLTLPLFWDNVTLRQSIGITNNAVAPGTPGVNEIASATAMCYYMGRLWYAQGRTYSAGDIVGGGSGTAINGNRDAVLNVTENPLATGGDNFTVPTNAGNIRALAYSANIDTQLGQGLLFIFTRKAIYSLSVPVTRTDWIAADSNNQPIQKVVQLSNGTVSDRSVVSMNGDLFFQSLEPSVRSLFMAIRSFSQWGNVSISRNMYRLLRHNDRALLHASSGIVFDNYLLQTALPVTKPQGIVHSALAVMDFTPLSSLSQQLPPIWNGAWDGLDIFQLFSGDFGGMERAYAVVLSRVDSSIQLWEITDAQKFNVDGDRRTTWVIEFPAYNWGREFDMKKLASAELWVDKLLGEVIYKLDYRPDGDECWHVWHEWKDCTARTTCDDLDNPVCYPARDYCAAFKSTYKMPMPPNECQEVSGRPVNQGYQFQCRLTIKGWCRVRGFILHTELVDGGLYDGLVC